MPDKCIKCNEPLERVRYRVYGLKGEFCRKCAHELYREGDYPFYLVDSEDPETPKSLSDDG